VSQDEELDFERADFGDGASGAAPGQIGCSLCQNPIADRYFTRNGAFVCAACEGPSRLARPPGSAFSRFLGALLAGGLAAAVASAIWLLVTELTGYEIGLIAIAVGWIVGVAVMFGNRGVGGLPYQLLALFLTYSAIVMTYVPAVAHEFETQWAAEDSKEEAEARAQPDFDEVAIDGRVEPSEFSAPRGAGLADPEDSAALAWILAIPIAYAVPFLAGFENSIGILIIGFGLYQAFTLTTRREIAWAGPFEVGRDSSA
jgi:hypothetical protein